MTHPVDPGEAIGDQGLPGQRGDRGRPGARPPGQHISWLLNNLTHRVPEVRGAVVLSSDGLLVAVSSEMERSAADRLAAIAAGLGSLAAGASRFFDCGAVRQTIIEMEQGFLFVTAVGDGSCLAVLTDASADMGLIAYEMALLVVRVGEFLDPGLRAPAPAAAAR